MQVNQQRKALLLSLLMFMLAQTAYIESYRGWTIPQLEDTLTEPARVSSPAVCASASRSSGDSIYVDVVEGSNDYPGTISCPLSSLEQAITIAGSESASNPEIILHAGLYHENVSINNIDNLLIRAADGERVVFDGTLSITDDLGGVWGSADSDGIQEVTLTEDGWQLFLAHEEQVPARWPNAGFDDQTVFNRSYWAEGTLTGSNNAYTKGWLTDAGPETGVHTGLNETVNLTGLDPVGAIAVMNLGSFRSNSRIITDWNPNNGTFAYNGDGVGWKTKHHAYFLEGKRELIDQDGEWWFNNTNNRLHYKTPSSQDANDLDLRVKVQPFAISVDGSDGVTIQGIDFFGTTVNFNNCDGCSLTNSTLEYPSTSKRGLGIAGESENDRWMTRFYRSTNSFVDNISITNTDGGAIEFQGSAGQSNNNTVNNSYFHAIDWSAADQKGLMVTIFEGGRDMYFTNNSVHLTGASSVLSIGDAPKVFYNEVWDVGHLQTDGAVVQVMQAEAPGSVIAYNWIHDIIKYGARFDAPINEPGEGMNGTMHHNVIWNAVGGLMVKGDYHNIHNNTVFNSSGKNDMIILTDNGINNGNSTIHQNAADKMADHRSDSWSLYPLPAGTYWNNWNGYVNTTDSVWNQLVDPANGDFRPKVNSHLDNMSAGAYDAGVSNPWTAGISWTYTTPNAPVAGCMLDYADNYDSDATLSDGSCTFSSYTPPSTLDLRLHLDPSNSNSYSGSGTNLVDLSTYGNDGTIDGAAWEANRTRFYYDGSCSGATNPPGQAGSYVCDEVTFAETNDHDPNANGDWSVSVWMNATTVQHSVIIGKWNGGGTASDLGYIIRIGSDNKLYTSVGTTSDSSAVSTSRISIDEDRWYHLVMVADSGNILRLYADGVNVANASLSGSGSIRNTTKGISIASYNAGEYNQPFDGNIGEVMIFADALNSTTINQMYNASKGSYSNTTSLSYSDSSYTFVKGQAYNLPLSVSNGDLTTSYTLIGSLPSGMSFGSDNGTIWGTPSADMSSATYTVTANNSAGSFSTSFQIQVMSAPSGITYSPSSMTLEKGTTMTTNTPTYSGSTVTSWSINPSLPSGLNIDASTGAISGTPTILQSTSQTYTVAATNSYGSTSTTVSIIINDQVPVISYTSPVEISNNREMTTTTPINTGGAVTSWEITPSLPTGLSFGTTNGSIWGTPENVTSNVTYTIYANNSGGSASTTLTLNINWTLTPSVDGAYITRNSSIGTDITWEWDYDPLAASNLTMSAGWRNTCAIRNDGDVYCWGRNGNGQIGNGNMGSQSGGYWKDRPTKTNNLGSDAVSVEVGEQHVCALLDTGIVKCWGRNHQGQIGVGSGGDKPSPQTVNLGSGRTATSIYAGNHHTCAILDDQSVKCWGLNSDGQLGIGSINNANTPTAINSLGTGRHAISLALGGGFTCALLDDGSVKCWGSDEDGRRGDGSGGSSTTSSPPSTAISLPSGRTAIQITAGDTHACALLDDGTAVCWGGNSEGQLGDGTTANRNAPTSTSSFGSGHKASYLSAGDQHTCALMIDGGVRCWGSNSNGELGDGTQNDRSSPPTTDVNLGSGYTAIGIGTGGGHTCAMLQDGDMKCWGARGSGQLGDDSNFPSSGNQVTPVFVHGTRVWEEGDFLTSPDVSGATCGISPALPTGLSLTSGTCAITGTPTVTALNATYTIWANISGQSFSGQIWLEVGLNVPLPSYSPNSYSLTKGTTISTISPSNTGGEVITWELDTSLPSGLNFGSSNGTIWGTPDTITSSATYTIWANNSAGSASTTITFMVNDIAPSISYSPSSLSLLKGAQMSALAVTNSGGTIVSCSVSPNLPNGMSLSSTCELSGTPSVATTNTSYTVTATNTGGSDSTSIYIEVLNSGGTLTVTPTHSTGSVNATLASIASSYSHSLTIPSWTSGVTNTSVKINDSGSVAGTAIAAWDNGNLVIAWTRPIYGSTTQHVLAISVYDGSSWTTQDIDTASKTGYRPSIAIDSQGALHIAYLDLDNTNLRYATNASGTWVLSTLDNSSVDPDNDAAKTGIAIDNKGHIHIIHPTKPSGVWVLNYTTNVSGSFVSTTITDTTKDDGKYASLAIAGNGSLHISVYRDSGGSDLRYYTDESGVWTNETVHTGSNYGKDSVIALNSKDEVVMVYRRDDNNDDIYMSVGNRGSWTSSQIASNRNAIYLAMGIDSNDDVHISSHNIGGSSKDLEYFTNSSGSWVRTTLDSGIGGKFGSMVVDNNDDVHIAHADTIGANDLQYATAKGSGKGLAVNPVFSVSPSLPEGLILNWKTGEITGIPTVASANTTYTLTATALGATTTTTFTLHVTGAPGDISYNDILGTNGFTITSVVPTVSTNGTTGSVTTWAINASLPNGLTFETSNGTIWGTPTQVIAGAVFTIWANNSAGSKSTTINITINDVSVSSFTYASENITLSYYHTMTTTTPTTTGGSATSWAISPSLPSGLTFNTATGAISGTPETLQTTTVTYTIWANNSGGSFSDQINITINDHPPAPINYFGDNITLDYNQTITPIDRLEVKPDVIAAGEDHTCAIQSDGSVRCWGEGSFGRLGHGGTGDKNTPTATSSLGAGRTAIDITAGSTHTCAVLDNGSVACWGANNYGQLGDGTTTNRMAPTQTVSLGRPAIAVEAGSHFSTCALLDNGSVSCWGRNHKGQLGRGFTNSTNDLHQRTPALTLPMPGGQPVVAIDISHYMVCGVLSNGGIACWGQYGGGNTPTLQTFFNSSNPAIDVSTSRYAGCGILENGSVTCWGTAWLGTGGESQSANPGVIWPNLGAGRTAVEVEMGRKHRCALLDDDSVKCWGDDSYGQLGNGAGQGSKNTPFSTTFSSNLGLQSMTSGHWHTCITSKTNEIYCWGDGSKGKQGDGSTSHNQNPGKTNHFSGTNPVKAFGEITSWAIHPAPPTGLSFDSTNGTLYGTPTAPLGQTNFTIYANNSGGSTSTIVTITINDQAPGPLQYNPQNNTLTNNTATTMAPTFTNPGGNVTSWVINASLPNGVSFGTNNGTIYGTPTELWTQRSYMVWANNSGGSSVAYLNITVVDQLPSIAYSPSDLSLTNNTVSIDLPLEPTLTGPGEITSWVINASLPSGVSFGTNNGTIYGTPTELWNRTSYTVWANNSGGSSVAYLNITVVDELPTLSYPLTALNLTNNTSSADLPLNATLTGSGEILSWAINASLPTGLTFETSNGTIWGTPTELWTTTAYTVYANNSGGSAKTYLNITVVDQVPTLSYSPASLSLINNTVSNDLPLAPTLAGPGEITSWAISETLPTGLNFGTNNGTIWGTPTSLMNLKTFTIWANNSGGSSSAMVNITINDEAPDISYSPDWFVLTNNTAMSPTATPTNSGGAISSRIIDMGGSTVGKHSSIAIDSYGFKHISYGRYGFFGEDLMYATDKSGSWVSTAVDSGGSVGVEYTSISVDSNDAVHISYYDTTNTNLKYATCSSSCSSASSWSKVTVDSSSGDVGGHTSISVDSNDAVHISYYDATNTNLKYATCSSSCSSASSWSKVTVDSSSGDVGKYGSIAIDSNDAVHISYRDSTLDDLKYATCSSSCTSASSWTISTIDSVGNVGSRTSIAIDSNDAVHISYHDITNGDLKYATDQTGSWANTTVDSVGTVGQYTSIAIDSNDVVHISYYDATNKDLKYASNMQSSIQTGVGNVIKFIDRDAEVGRYSSIAVDSNGDVHISYYDATNSALRYAALQGVHPWNVYGYSISPALPAGLEINMNTGEISGTPTALSTNTTYTITASNTGGTNTTTITIEVVDHVPTLTYSPENLTLTKGIQNTDLPLSATLSGPGEIVTWEINATLPAGLNFGTSNGTIWGTPTALQTNVVNYTIWANNTGGSSSATISIIVNDQLPNISYNPENLSLVNNTVSGDLPLNVNSNGPGIILSWEIYPSLPSGLSFGTNNGTIWGVPSTLQISPVTYTVFANNSGGSSQATVNITIIDQLPSLSYSPQNFTLVNNTANSNLPISATLNGPGVITSWEISPAVPAGLTFGTTNGSIWGTPTSLQTTTVTYIIWANNSGGSSNATINITIIELDPLISYSPNDLNLTKNTNSPHLPLLPSNSGGPIPSYVISTNNTNDGKHYSTFDSNGFQHVLFKSGNGWGYSTNQNGTWEVNTNFISGVSSTYGSTVCGFEIDSDDNMHIVNARRTGSSTTYLEYMTNQNGSWESSTLQTNLNSFVANNPELCSFSYGDDGSIHIITLSNSSSRYINYLSDQSGSWEYTTFSGYTSDIKKMRMVLNSDNDAVVSWTHTPERVYVGTLANGEYSLDYSDSGTGVGGFVDIFVDSSDVVHMVNSKYAGSNGFAYITNQSGSWVRTDLPSPPSTSYHTSNAAIAVDDSGKVQIIGHRIGSLYFTNQIMDLTYSTYDGSSWSTTILSNSSYESWISLGFDRDGKLAITTDTHALGQSSGYTGELATIAINGSTAYGYSITPNLPNGLFFNPVSGAISGKSTVLMSKTMFTITGTNSGGSSTTYLNITVVDLLPNFTYSPENITLTNNTGSADLPLIPTNQGPNFGDVDTWEIEGTLPAGLNFGTTNGTIWGIATELWTTTPYTIWGNNSGGSLSVNINITVIDAVPIVSYSPSDLTIYNNTASIHMPFAPTISGQGDIVTWELNASLPSGLSFGNNNGTIYGISTQLWNQTAYKVWANNTGGSIQVYFNITVVDNVPSISYNPQNITLYKNTIPTNLPTAPIISGQGEIIAWEISPSMPPGLNFGNDNGTIWGMPTQLQLSPVSYTIYGNNSGGTATAMVNITILHAEPMFTYTSYNLTLVNNTLMTSLSPTSTGGIITTWEVSQSLPVGISFDSSTGSITGTPTVVQSVVNYTIWGNNTGGSHSIFMEITIYDPAVSLEYNPENFTLTRTQAMVNQYPIFTGIVDNWTILPALPSGLTFTDGVISGTPTVNMTTTIYTIWANNTGGPSSHTINITILEPIVVLNYNPENLNLTRNQSMSTLNPILSGGYPLSWEIYPALPSGLVMTNGVISGTPLVNSTLVMYTIWANNTGGSANHTINITILEPPIQLTYNPSNLTLTRDIAMNPLIPTFSGGLVENWSITPSLAQGLTFTNGLISGTPTVNMTITMYTIWANNSGGNTSTTINITILEPIVDLSYNPENITLIRNQSMSTLYPTVAGGNPSSWGIHPTLPAGLIFDNGVISGTPQINMTVTMFTIFANTTGGSATANINITIVEPVVEFVMQPSELVLTRNLSMTPIFAIISGGAVATWGVSPDLPAGLTFIDGILSGTPEVNLTRTQFALYANNTGGSAIALINITILEPAPQIAINPANITLMRGVTMDSISAEVIGDAMPENWSIWIELPDGLEFDNGTISGTPLVNMTRSLFLIWANNSGGSTSIQFEIEILEPPTIFSFTPENYTLTKGEDNASIIPSLSGGNAEIWTISPALPDGMHFENGSIFGIPLIESLNVTYTITATNSGGSNSTQINISVVEPVPILSVDTPLVLTRYSDLANTTVNNTGGIVATWEIYPALPQGITLVDGLISGIARENMSATTFTIWANNSGGSSSIEFTLEVLEPAPIIRYLYDKVELVQGISETSLIPISTGGEPVSWAIDPELPSGLIFTDGLIYGTPTEEFNLTTFTVWANNSQGSSSSSFQIESNYPVYYARYEVTRFILETNQTIEPIVPLYYFGEDRQPIWSIESELPEGLTFDNGVISGTTLAPSNLTTYNVLVTGEMAPVELFIIIEVRGEIVETNQTGNNQNQVDSDPDTPTEPELSFIIPLLFLIILFVAALIAANIYIAAKSDDEEEDDSENQG